MRRERAGRGTCVELDVPHDTGLQMKMKENAPLP